MTRVDHRSVLDRTLRLPLGAVIVLGIFWLQWLAFTAFLRREILWAYPTYFDQASYLDYSYRTFEQLRTGPFLGSLWDALTAGLPQGSLLHVEAALLYLLLGPSRESALTVNFLHWVILEACLVATLRWATGRWSLALAGLGLLMATTARMAAAGAMSDFRLDFAGLCLYGVFLCAVVRSNTFLLLGWSLCAGAVAGWLILTRHLTALSLASLMGTALAGALFMAWHTRTAPTGSAWARRARLIVASGLVTVGIAAPMLWNSRAQIVAYYGSHVTTEEGPLRLLEFGATQFSVWLLYYPRSVVGDHLGNAFLGLAALIGVVLVYRAVLGRRRVAGSTAAAVTPVDLWPASAFAGLAVVVPITILTAFPTRSPVVGAFVVPAIVLLAQFAVVWIARTTGTAAVDRGLLAALVTACVALGLFVEASEARRGTSLRDSRDEVRKVGELVDAIGTNSVRYGWQTPKVTMDRLRDYLHVAMLQPWLYERSGRMIAPIAGVPVSIVGVDATAALRAIAESDFVILTDPASPDEPGFPYPVNATMRMLYPQALAVVRDGFSAIATTDVFSQSLTLYMRRAHRIEGDSAGWLTRAGFTLVVPGAALDTRPVIRVTGRSPLHEYFPRPLAASAQALVPGREPMEVSAAIDASGGTYTLTIQVPLPLNAGDTEVRFRVRFDQFVVPRDVGINDDTRQLVVMTPTTVTLVPAERR